MAGQKKFVLQGAAVISRSDYVASGGAGTFTDVGYTDGEASIELSWDSFEFEPEQELGPINDTPFSTKATLKFTMWEQMVDNFLMAFKQPAANKSGTGDNLTLEVGPVADQYHQMKLVGKGPGTNKVRTWTVWNCSSASASGIKSSKKEPGKVEITMKALVDPSVAAAGKIFKQVDT